MTVSTPTKLGAFTVALAVGFAAAFGIGSAASPIADAEAATTSDHDMTTSTLDSLHLPDTIADSSDLPGLAVSSAGYTLVPVATELPTGLAVDFTFTVTGPDGQLLATGYDTTHEKELHLIVVRRDLSGFQHVHPTRNADGTWSVPLDFADAGTWRAFADFAPTALGRNITLGSDFAVAGDYQPVPLRAPVSTFAIDGYEISLAGAPTVGAPSELTFEISRDGHAVPDLEPYLGAYGHLVTLRAGDLVYLHTHPEQHAEAGQVGGPTVSFSTEFPSAGNYRLFLDFQHGGAVHTAEFTVLVPNSSH